MSKILALFVIAVLAFVAHTVSASTYGYDLSIALRAFRYAKASYCDASSIADWSCDACPLHPNFKIFNVYTNSSIESQAYSGFDPTNNAVVVAFRGSSNIPNWINDLDFVFVDYPYCGGCQVHHGFYDEWKSYESAILGDVQSMLSQNPGASIFVAGHSLGAAVAVHAMVTFNRLRLASVMTYTIGLPRVGNPAFAEWADLIAGASNGNSQHVTNDRDPVPHVPPLDFGYLHVLHETWYPSGGQSPQQNCDDTATAEDPNCSDSLLVYNPLDHLTYFGGSTECNMNDGSNSALRGERVTMEISPALKQKLHKIARSEKIHSLKQKNKK